jgi:hypothetical protein
MFRPYAHEEFQALEHHLRGAADDAAKRRDARREHGRRRGRANAALAAGLRGLADRLDARPNVPREVATEASGPC